MNIQTTLILVFITMISACQRDKNVADCEEGRKEVPCSEQTPDEKAKLALQDKDYDTAIAIYVELIDGEPEEYERYTLLAASYAGKAQLSIIDLVTTADFSSGSLIEGMAAFLPSPEDFSTTALYDTAVTDMKTSVQTLQSIPAALRATTSEETYAPSAIFQLTLYQSAYSIMFMNKFVVNTSGEFDEAQLENMTEEDALEILNNLQEAGSLGGEDSAELQGKINSALTDIEGQEGESNSEKLKEFLKKEQNGEEATP